MPIPFTFDERTHICRDLKGNWIPSVTQVLEAQGLSFDFKRFVPRDILDRRGLIGSDVHVLTDVYDEYGDVNPTWLRPETEGYLESWVGLRRISGFVPSQWSVRLCDAINGFPVTCEFDKYGTLGRFKALIDIKTGAVKADSWGAQLAPYEMLKFQSPKIGRVVRAVAHLQPDGSPGKLLEYPEFSPIDGLSYADTFLSALQNIHWRIRRGYLDEGYFLGV